ncbi:MAG: hypothetical protein BGO90_07410 [Legionella sp. 40-6]|nr:MAG: hypothetical protein BGO90_07410 [Legionella sp. 40-6]
MTDTSPDTQKKTASQSPPKSANIPKEVDINKNPSHILPIAALILALGSGVTSVYLVTQQQDLNQKIQLQQQNLNNQLQERQQNNLTLKKEIDLQTQRLHEEQNTLNTKLAELEKTVHQSLGNRLEQPEYWQWLKVRYLLELAQINAHWSTDNQSTEALLRQADQILAAQKEEAVLKIRQAIAQDITQIQTANTIDSIGILSQLDAVQKNISELDFPTLAQETKGIEAKDHPGQEFSLSQWRKNLGQAMDQLGKLVVIRRQDEPVHPLISPAMSELLKENLILNLQEAQWGVLARNNQVYQLALKQAEQMIRKHFNINTPLAETLLKNLNELSAKNIATEPLKIDRALPLINELIQEKVNFKTGESS